MPVISPAIRDRYLSIFREKRIEPQHIGFGVPVLVEDGIANQPCHLCATEFVDERYEVDFAIPLSDGEVRRKTIGPASANCIAQALCVLAESIDDLDNLDTEVPSNLSEDLYEVLRTLGAVYSNNWTVDQSVQQRRRRSIDATFLIPPYLSVQEYFDGAKRERWAEFGDTRISRALGLVDDLAKFWTRVASGPTRHWPDPNNLLVMSVQVPMNLTELRYTNVRQATLCSLCGEFFAEIYPMHNGPDVESRGLLEADNYICEFCDSQCHIRENPSTNAEIDPILRPDVTIEDPLENLSAPSIEAVFRAMGSAITDDAERIALLTRLENGDTTTEEDALFALSRDPRLLNIPEADRTLIVRSLMREPQSQIINSITSYGLRRGRITESQRGVLQRRLESRGLNSEAPRCPVHQAPMMLVEGQFGQFYSCQDFPHCRIACNLQGQFRGVPDGTEISQASPVIDMSRRITLPSGGTTTIGIAETRSASPGAGTPIVDGLDTLGSIARARSQEPTPSNLEAEAEAAREQGRKFRKILIATIKQKCQID